MTNRAGSSSFSLFPDDLYEDRSASPLKVLSLNCSNVQILDLAKYFRQHQDWQILGKVEEYRCQSSVDSNSNRNSLFSVRSASSQATTLSNQSRSHHNPSERLRAGICPQPHDFVRHQASPVPELIEPTTPNVPVAISKSSPPAYICVACNISFTAKSCLSRHQKEHCERKIEWSCGFCIPAKTFYRRDKLIAHHRDHYGQGCVQGCKQRGGLCDWHLAGAASELPLKQAWGCPCCHRCFDSFDAWAKHGANHPVENSKIVGWSLTTMVQSLLLQPFLAEAIARSPLQIADLTKAKVEVCHTLKEALERHKLPDAVQAHYDYRHLKLPEALALYAFRLVAYGDEFLDSIPVANTGTSTTNMSVEPYHNGLDNQLFASTAYSTSGALASGYWNPQQPFNYHSNSCPPGEARFVPNDPNRPLFENASSDSHAEAKSFQSSAQSTSRTFPVQPHQQSPQAVSAVQSAEQTLRMQFLGHSDRTSQESNISDKRRGRCLSMRKSIQNLVLRPSSSRPSIQHTDAIPPIPTLPDSSASEISRTAAMPDYDGEVTRFEPVEANPTSPHQARLSGRMSGIQWDAWVTWQPEEFHDR